MHLEPASMATFIHAFAEGDKLAYHGTVEDDGASPPSGPRNLFRPLTRYSFSANRGHLPLQLLQRRGFA